MNVPNLRQTFFYLLIASVAISAVIGIVVILIGNFGEFETKILLTTLTVTVTSVLSIVIGALTVVTPIFHRLSTGEVDVAKIDAEVETLKKRIEELQLERDRN